MEEPLERSRMELPHYDITTQGRARRRWPRAIRDNGVLGLGGPPAFGHQSKRTSRWAGTRVWDLTFEGRTRTAQWWVADERDTRRAGPNKSRRLVRARRRGAAGTRHRPPTAAAKPTDAVGLRSPWLDETLDHCLRLHQATQSFIQEVNSPGSWQQSGIVLMLRYTPSNNNKGVHL